MVGIGEKRANSILATSEARSDAGSSPTRWADMNDDGDTTALPWLMQPCVNLSWIGSTAGARGYDFEARERLEPEVEVARDTTSRGRGEHVQETVLSALCCPCRLMAVIETEHGTWLVQDLLKAEDVARQVFSQTCGRGDFACRAAVHVNAHHALRCFLEVERRQELTTPIVASLVDRPDLEALILDQYACRVLNAILQHHCGEKAVGARLIRRVLRRAFALVSAEYGCYCLQWALHAASLLANRGSTAAAGELHAASEPLCSALATQATKGLSAVGTLNCGLEIGLDGLAEVALADAKLCQRLGKDKTTEDLCLLLIRRVGMARFLEACGDPSKGRLPSVLLRAQIGSPPRSFLERTLRRRARAVPPATQERRVD